MLRDLVEPPVRQPVLPPRISHRDLDQRPVVRAAIVLCYWLARAELAVSPDGSLRTLVRWMLRVVTAALIVLLPSWTLLTIGVAVMALVVEIVWQAVQALFWALVLVLLAALLLRARR